MFKYGIRDTFIILAIGQSVTGAFCALLCPPPRPRIMPRKFLNRPVLRSPSFYLILFSATIFHCVLGNPGLLAPDFGRAIGMNSGRASITLAIMNGAGAPSRPLVGWLGDKFGRQGISLASTGVAAVMVMGLWLPSAFLSSQWMFWVFSVVYGMVASGFAQFVSPILLDLFGPDVYFSVNAAVAIFRGVGSLVGGPIAAKSMGLKDKGKAENAVEYVRPIVLTGVVLVGSMLAMFVVWLLGRRTDVVDLGRGEDEGVAVMDDISSAEKMKPKAKSED
jgi:MFS family permease